MPPEMLSSVVEELQREVLMAEAIIGQKDKENAALRLQIRQFEVRWSEYESKMKFLEAVWQKHTAFLQVSLLCSKLLLGIIKHLAPLVTYSDITDTTDEFGCSQNESWC